MIIVTGAAGFIGSGLISKLNELGFKQIIAVLYYAKFYWNHEFKFLEKITNKCS